MPPKIPVYSLELPGAAADRRAYARCLGKIIVASEKALTMTSLVNYTISVAISASRRQKLRTGFEPRVFRIRSFRLEDTGARMMVDRRAISTALPEAITAKRVPINCPEALRDEYSSFEDSDLAWLHTLRPMGFKEFAKLALLTLDELLLEDPGLAARIVKAWPLDRYTLSS